MNLILIFFNKYLMLKIFNILNYILKKLTKIILKELIRQSIKPEKFNESKQVIIHRLAKKNFFDWKVIL